MAEHPNVLMGGAGIIGASIAWHLCRAGARVTPSGLERFPRRVVRAHVQ
jgi:glycine/D-amino acid oxidase-like deaminating enzyme